MDRHPVRVILCLLSCLAVAGALACCRNDPAATGAPGGAAPAGEPEGVLAVVNGVPVTEADLRAETHAKTAGPELTPAQRKAFLDRVIGRELVAQKAAELALGDAQYRQELARRTAELNAWRRKALADAYYHRLSTQEQPVTDAEARRWFDEHAEEIRAEVHVWQILARDEGQITQARMALERGASFEEVARERFPDLPAGEKPWDLGWLKWKQVPPAWREVLPKMKPGDTSDVIRGAGGRFWIVRLVERRVDAGLEFDQARPVILEDLKALRMEEARTRVPEDLRKAARVEIRLDPGPSR